MSEPKYEIILYWDNQDRIFVAEVPELRGCMAHGKTRITALHAAEEAIAVWVRTAREDGQAIPEPAGRVAG